MSTSTPVKVVGIILGYRRGSGRQYVDQVYVKVVTSAEDIHSLVGRKVEVSDTYGNRYLGKVIKVHGSGKNGVVIVTFNTNIPGQLIGSEVTIF